MSSTVAVSADEPLPEPDPSNNISNNAGLLHSHELRKFVKFCIVGAGSTIVTFVVLNVCKYVLDLPLFTSLTFAFLCGVINGFVWNRKWTFKEARSNSAHEQSLKFFAVNVVGYLLNTTIVVLIVAHFTAVGTGFFGSEAQFKQALYDILVSQAKQHYSSLLVNGAQGTAVCIVVWWNFFANRHWTFKH